MLNRTPPSNNNTSNVLNAYRKRRQQRGPLLIYGATALVVIVLIVLAVWLLGSKNKPLSGLFATDTPTATLTFTPTNTNTPTLTPTLTLTPTVTITPTPTGPVDYTIVEGDTLQGIAEKFNLGADGVLLILDSNPTIMENNGVYFVGQTISVPPIGTLLKTTTPIPANLGRGTKIEYQVLPGDTLAGIAAKFNSKEEDIITLNKIENANALQAGQSLQIPVNLVTATATLPSTSTPVTPTIAGQPTQAAPAATVAGTTGCAPTENAAFVTEVQTLINTERAKSNLPALSVNQKLVTAAKEHAADMICNNYLSHIGLNNSTPEFRVAAQDYSGSFVLENLYAQPQSTAQSAFTWWMNDSANRANILNAEATEIGISYMVSDKSLLGGYFVVIFAKP
ncbi:MAG: LysM peptidoglycan-binding domain-containing protein [Chloroflexota bacterium]